MNDQSPLEQLIATLLEKQPSAQVERKIEQLSNKAMEQFANQARTFFTDEEVRALDQSGDKDEVDAEMLRLYKVKTGEDPEQVMQAIMDDLASTELAQLNQVTA